MPRSPSEHRPLFRKEAIDAQREKFLGEAGLAQPIRLWVYTVVAMLIAAIVVAVAVWGHYTRRERVQGYLTSAVGTAVVRTTEAGIITDLSVKEGDVVKAGQRLGVLTIDRSGVNGLNSNETIRTELARQKQSRETERVEIVQSGHQQVEQLGRRVASLQQQLHESDLEIATQRERLKSANEIADLWKNMQSKEFVSPIFVQQKADDARDQSVKLQQMLRGRATLAGDLATAQADIPLAQNRTRQQLDQIDQRISEMTQQSAELAGRLERDVSRDMVITAPIDGIVTNIGPAHGQTVAADTQFATILPKDSALHAELLVPTRAIGFVHVGQPVTLRYEAFPYERFGQYHGRVESVGKDIWTQGQTVGPLSAHEPVYRIVVAIDKQEITSGKDSLPLRAGMVASADLLMERRTLLEWLFQPIIQLRERMRSGSSELSRMQSNTPFDA
jgi:membrane fusion protein